MVTEVQASSNLVSPGTLFVAIAGTKVDGHSFLCEAAERGAVAAVVQQKTQRPAGLPGQFPLIPVPDCKVALSRIAAWRYGDPSQALRTIGITGTNGKTTSSWLVFHLLNQLGLPALRTGTLGAAFGEGGSVEGTLTTPDAIQLQRLMSEALGRNLVSCVMEVSSHALDQARSDAVAFDVAAFTNLTRDHLDYHVTMEAYFSAKRKLFSLLADSSKPHRTAVIGIDDEYGARLYQELKRESRIQTVSFGFDPSSDICISRYSEDMRGSSMSLSFAGESYEVYSAFIGRHNAQNIATAFGCVVGLGLPASLVAARLGKLPQVPGRLERVHDADPSVYVDYAHTPDALEKALQSLRAITPGKLWVVFGCGGDRDGGKRPLMADVAAALADGVVVTSDNPRTEDPMDIIAQIVGGQSGPGIKSSGIIEPDRRKAIAAALASAGAGDVILIAGKGHEEYQIIGTTKHHFSDQEEVRAFYATRSCLPA